MTRTSANAAAQSPQDQLNLIDPRTLDLAKYLTISKLNIPDAYDWSTKKTTPWGMMGNWDLGDCLCAAAGHMIECWTSHSTGEVYIDNNAVINAYIALTGYDPITGQNDKGVGYTNLMKYWRKVGIGNHKIKAYTAVKYNKHEFVKACIYLFGGAFVGLGMPKSLNTDNEVWDVAPGELTGDNAPGSDGGHAVTVLGYDEQYLTFITYGKKKRMTWAFWNAYSNELYAVISHDFFNGDKTAAGFDMATLEADLIRITREKPLLEKELVKYLSAEKAGSVAPLANSINTDNPYLLGNLQVMLMDVDDTYIDDAMQACANLGEGWRLPTLDELRLLYNAKDAIGRFQPSAYWCSTLPGEDTADRGNYRYYKNFDNGYEDIDIKSNWGYVRAVRTMPI